MSTPHQRHNAPPSEPELRVKALETLLIEKGLVDAHTLDLLIDTYENKIGPKNGAKVVARAWVDPEFKEALLTNGREAVRELDIPSGRLGALGVAENTPAIHNVVVCTLCSCYPHDLLGDPPWWYRHDTYKERIVRDPRGTLADMFGLQVPQPSQLAEAQGAVR